MRELRGKNALLLRRTIIIAFYHSRPHIAFVVSEKKQLIVKTIALVPKATGYRAIRLVPSKSDYKTFAKTTALAMGKSAQSASESKPNTLLLSLLNLAV